MYNRKIHTLQPIQEQHSMSLTNPNRSEYIEGYQPKL
jgi:hypothetical protein